ncbi:hypothetical protein Ddc_13409 [Ditylenchus destructor]|nr:hypothetical protein Ddc_13409 [Ditylenchus destructor]
MNAAFSGNMEPPPTYSFMDAKKLDEEDRLSEATVSNVNPINTPAVLCNCAKSVYMLNKNMESVDCQSAPITKSPRQRWRNRCVVVLIIFLCALVLVAYFSSCNCFNTDHDSMSRSKQPARPAANSTTGLCPPGYACNRNNFCYSWRSSSLSGPCANASSSIGPCVKEECPVGYVCGGGKLCYPAVTASPVEIGFCVDGQCPTYYVCGAGNLCYPIPSNSINKGPCVDGQCPTGYACGGGNLCYEVSER